MSDKMHWFNQVKFGMFIHWGIYSIHATGEWAQFREQIPPDQYESYMHRFNPDRFDPQEWVELAKEAGMGYMVFTSKHHDGFCMFDSQYTDYKSTNTPTRRDFVAELAKACHEGGLHFGIYYSLWDMHFPGLHRGEKREKPEIPSSKGVEYIHKQAEELLTKYGKIDYFFFDGRFATPEHFRADELIAKMRKLQPGILINNRLGLSCDVATPENQLPDEPIMHNGKPMRWETCMCTNDNWGYVHSDLAYKSAKELIRNLVEAISKGGNLLLNVGPTARGNFPEPWYPDRFEKIGQWLIVNGESIYGTTPCDYGIDNRFRWRGYKWTGKGNTLYLHVIKYPYNGRMVIPFRKDVPVDYMYLLHDGSEVQWEIGPDFQRLKGTVINLSLPPHCPDPIDTVVAVKLKA